MQPVLTSAAPQPACGEPPNRTPQRFATAWPNSPYQNEPRGRSGRAHVISPLDGRWLAPARFSVRKERFKKMSTLTKDLQKTGADFPRAAAAVRGLCIVMLRFSGS